VSLRIGNAAKSSVAGPVTIALRRNRNSSAKSSSCRNLGRDGSDHSGRSTYFVDGVTESPTTDLSRISGSFVIGRNTAFARAEKPPALVASPSFG
jgi:TolB-like protein